MSSAIFRELFPVTRNLIYFNHAALGPLSVRAAEAMQQFVSDQRDHGALHWKTWYAEDARFRESAAKLIGAQAEEIAILKNTSEGLSFVAQGIRWKEGDNVITTALEFASNWTPWKRLEPRGVECRVARSFEVSDIEALIDDRTRLVTVSAVAFHNGAVADLVAIGELCARRNVRFCVDAIQALGVLPIDARRAKIDFLASDGHKWTCGPEGAAIFYVARERREELEVIETGWTNVDRQGKFIETSVELVPGARRFEAGSLNTAGIYGMRAALDLTLEIGIETIREHAVRVGTLLADGIESIGWSVATPRPIASPIIGATPPDVEKSIRWYHGEIEKKGIISAPREGLLRFSPHYYNDETEVERVVEALKSLTVRP